MNKIWKLPFCHFAIFIMLMTLKFGTIRSISQNNQEEMDSIIFPKSPLEVNLRQENSLNSQSQKVKGQEDSEDSSMEELEEMSSKPPDIRNKFEQSENDHFIIIGTNFVLLLIVIAIIVHRFNHTNKKSEDQIE